MLASSGGNSKILWGSYHSALVKSTDLGVTWLPIYITQAGLPQPPVLQFDIDSGDPNIVYLGTTLAAGGMWKSADGGATWTAWQMPDFPPAAARSNTLSKFQPRLRIFI